jgi:hypothetical protein
MVEGLSCLPSRYRDAYTDMLDFVEIASAHVHRGYRAIMSVAGFCCAGVATQRTDHNLPHPDSPLSLLSRGSRVGWTGDYRMTAVAAVPVSRSPFMRSDRRRRVTHHVATLHVWRSKANEAKQA